jgi:hypothetical protein
MTTHKFVVIYMWRGERHQTPMHFTSLVDAEAYVDSFRTDGWLAWVETL